jgi:hypothetical protein
VSSNDTNLGPISHTSFCALSAHDETLIGTPAYLGVAFFWNHEYRIPMRDVSFTTRRRVHRALLTAGLALDGKSRKHQQIIDANMRAVDRRRLLKLYGGEP